MEAFVSSFPLPTRGSFVSAKGCCDLYGQKHDVQNNAAARPRRAGLWMSEGVETGGTNFPTAASPTTTPPNAAAIAAAKAELYRMVGDLNMGQDVLDDAAAQAEVDTAIASLEALNPTPMPADHPLRNGRWRLVYTTSPIVLGRSRPGFARPEKGWQTLEMADGQDEGTVRNEEESTFFGILKVRNQIVGKCRALKGTRIRLKFEKFTIGKVFQVPFPGNVVGWQDQTFLDQELRVARTHTGNVFVLKRDTLE